MCHSASIGSAVPLRVQAYIETIVRTCADGGRGLVSVVLFGSGAIGGWVETVSDVDLILVVPGCATVMWQGRWVTSRPYAISGSYQARLPPRTARRFDPGTSTSRALTAHAPPGSSITVSDHPNGMPTPQTLFERVWPTHRA
jgi:hypothetical protein